MLKTKTKLKLFERFPYWLSRWIPVKTDIKIAGETVPCTVKRGYNSSWDSYLSERVEVFSYYHKGEFKLAEVILQSIRNAGRMLAINTDNRILFIQPNIKSVAFSECSWANLAVADITDLNWQRLEQKDIDLFGFDEHSFERLDFEDFVCQNPNLNSETLSFLFIKYSV